MKVIVTGGSGNVGTYVVAELKQKHDVIIADVKEPQTDAGVEYRPVDLLDARATKQAIKGADIVVHLAAIPHPFNDPGEKVMQVNMVCTYNVLEAIRQNKIPRAVYGGSDSGTGFGIHEVAYRPQYLPIDVEHPCWPHESYGLTKYFGEVMFREYSRAYGIEVIVVRFLWVWLERDRPALEKIIARQVTEPFEWLGGYVMPQDVAQLVGRAVDYRMDKGKELHFEAYFAHAAQTFLPVDTLEQAKGLWGTLPEIRRPEIYAADPRAPFFDISDARRKLGYEPRYTYQDF